MKIEWTHYSGKKILYVNFKGLNEDESREQLVQEMRMIAEAKEPVLLLVNLEGAVMSPETTQFTREKLMAFGSKVKKSALTGVTGFKPVIVEGIGRSAKDLNQSIFATEEEAKEWLVS